MPQLMIMIIRMFVRVYFGISAIYEALCGEVSYCFVGMLPSCISMMSYFSEPSPWILIQPFSGPVFPLCRHPLPWGSTVAFAAVQRPLPVPVDGHFPENYFNPTLVLLTLRFSPVSKPYYVAD